MSALPRSAKEIKFFEYMIYIADFVDSLNLNFTLGLTLMGHSKIQNYLLWQTGFMLPTEAIRILSSLFQCRISKDKKELNKVLMDMYILLLV